MTSQLNKPLIRPGISRFLIVGLALLATGSSSRDLATDKNRRCIYAILNRVPTALAGLAEMFVDPCIVDDGSVVGRLHAVLMATEQPLVPGLHTGIYIGMTGFRQELMDPWLESTDQAGHFLTAARLAIDPAFLSSPISLLLLGSSGDDDIPLRLLIGHEKEPDPPNAHRLELNLPTFIAVARSVRTQYHSVTEQDIANFRAGNLAAIPVGTGFGNSAADLKLSYIGWQFGQWIAEGRLKTKGEVDQWVKVELGQP